MLILTQEELHLLVEDLKIKLLFLLEDIVPLPLALNSCVVRQALVLSNSRVSPNEKGKL